jgi:hypothetical protein
MAPKVTRENLALERLLALKVRQAPREQRVSLGCQEEKVTMDYLDLEDHRVHVENLHYHARMACQACQAWMVSLGNLDQQAEMASQAFPE